MDERRWRLPGHSAPRTYNNSQFSSDLPLRVAQVMVSDCCGIENIQAYLSMIIFCCTGSCPIHGQCHSSRNTPVWQGLRWQHHLMTGLVPRWPELDDGPTADGGVVDLAVCVSMVSEYTVCPKSLFAQIGPVKPSMCMSRRRGYGQPLMEDHQNRPDSELRVGRWQLSGGAEAARGSQEGCRIDPSRRWWEH